MNDHSQGFHGRTQDPLALSAGREHTVEDARTKHREEPKKEKKQKGKGKRDGKTILTIAITLLCFSLTLIGADLLTGRSTFSDYVALFRKKGTDEEIYYAVYAASSQDMAIAYRNASVVRTEGGAGYVLKDDDTYYVLLNVYSDKSDAEKVADRQSNYGVYEIAIAPYSSEKNPSLEKAGSTKDLYREAYEFLYESANDLASGKITEEAFKQKILQYKETVAAKESAYAESIKGTEDTPAIEYKVILAEIRSAFENLAESEKAVADARYFSAMILHGFSLFSAKYYAK